ncbi:hypothetical protein [Glaciimonas sp. PAMC28666]|uniref:hypothetical protein n=1 Tax=Glaciimonas sp. PAMC28666 TaxID=2807626 RepID=UPI001963B0B1|nr:hypothetical protein [Glaciimonas sp. PAMC28666]QRX84674.1 hypothetical protein JQN73_11125 [Glaciimonas sp. PAMC28666]
MNKKTTASRHHFDGTVLQNCTIAINNEIDKYNQLSKINSINLYSIHHTTLLRATMWHRLMIVIIDNIAVTLAEYAQCKG